MDLLELSASPYRLYVQAKRIAKSTSRANNPDWYRRAAELPVQWHLWVGMQEAVSAVYDAVAGKWFEGPPLPPIAFTPDENGRPGDLDENSRNALHELLRNIFVSKAFAKKPKSLGIVLHLADEFRVRDLSPEFASDTDFNSLNELLGTAPDIALGDDSVGEEGCWRLLPLLGVVESDKKSVAIQVSSKYEKVIDAFREYSELRNLPVIVEVKAAPLEAISGLPALFPELPDFRNTLTLLQFDAFTVLCATGKRGEVLMVRPLAHRSGEFLSPGEVAEFLTNSGALLNLKSPRIVSVSLSRGEIGLLKQQLAVYAEHHPDCEVQLADAKRSELVSELPGRRFEFAVAGLPLREPDGKPQPLEELRQRWAVQDFYSLPREEVDKMPARVDFQILRFASIGQKVALAAVLALGGWIGADFYSKMSSDVWKASPTAAAEMQLRLEMLQKERREWQHWNNLLQKRSEGWLALGALTDLFPEEGGVVISRASYRAQTTAEDTRERAVGVSREWAISGYANPEVATFLPTLGSRSRVAELFDAMAEENLADYLKASGDTRSINVTLQQRQGAMPPSAAFPARIARHYRTAFDLRLSQGFDAKDDLAISTRPLSHE